MPKSEFLCLSVSGLLLGNAGNSLTSIVEASGLGGRLFTRALVLGGGGKLEILVGFRIVLPGVGKADNGEVDAELSFDT